MMGRGKKKDDDEEEEFGFGDVDTSNFGATADDRTCTTSPTAHTHAGLIPTAPHTTDRCRYHRPAELGIQDRLEASLHATFRPTRAHSAALGLAAGMPDCRGAGGGSAGNDRVIFLSHSLNTSI